MRKLNDPRRLARQLKRLRVAVRRLERYAERCPRLHLPACIALARDYAAETQRIGAAADAEYQALTCQPRLF